MDRKKPHLVFNVLISTTDGSMYCDATCLEMDLVDAGTTNDLDALARDMADIIQTQLQETLENDNVENAYRGAPLWLWLKWSKAGAPTNRIIRKIIADGLHMFDIEILFYEDLV